MPTKFNVSEEQKQQLAERGGNFINSKVEVVGKSDGLLWNAVKKF